MKTSIGTMKATIGTLCTISALSLSINAWPQLAEAQEAPTGQPDTVAQAADATEPTVADDAGDIPVLTLPPVTVTSQKIEQDLQDTPISIEVYTEEQITDQNIEDIDDIAKKTPNFWIAKTGGRGQFTPLAIRGVVSGNADFANPTVGLFVDGFALGGGYDFDFYDTERVEVLRGPQATLYGRNNLGGVVNVISKRPTDEWTAQGDFQASRFNTYQGRAAVGGPITEDLSFRLTGVKLNSDGFLRNRFKNQSSETRNDFSGRAQLRYQPTDELDINFNVNGFDYNGRFGSYAPLTAINEDHYVVDLNRAGEANQSALGQILDASYETEDFAITSISGHRYWRSTESLDTDYTPQELSRDRSRQKNDQYSQEFRFTSPADADRLTWVSGLFFSYENQETSDQFTVEPPLFGVVETTTQDGQVKVKQQNYAVFGQITYGVTDKLFLTAGLRYDYVFKDMNSNFDINTPSGQTPFPRTEADTSFQAVLPKGVIEYRWTPEISTYASVSRGYKPGGYQTFQAQIADEKYDSEFSTSYEIGVKARFLDDRVQLNLAGFHIDIEDLQFATVLGPNQVAISNAGRGHSTGFEIQGSALLLPGWEVFGSFGYVEAEIDRVKSGTTGTFSGARPANVPRYTGSSGSQYSHESGFFANFDVSTIGDYFLDSGNTVRQDPFFLLNAKVGWEFENFALYGFGTNLLDEHYITRSFQGTLPGQGFVARQGEPLSAGVIASVQF